MGIVSGVASYVGAWIETYRYVRYLNGVMSHPTWVRGLKLKDRVKELEEQMSHPTWVRGLKLIQMVLLVLPHSRILRGCVD